MKKLNIQSIVIAALIAIPICIGAAKSQTTKANIMPVNTTDVEIQTETFTEVEIIHQVAKQPETATEAVTEATTEPQLISMGTFTITAYCKCNLCCGKFSDNRPLDEYGNPIVYGASGEELIADYSIAVDVDLIPYGETIIINDREYIAHDCGGAIQGKRIDIYMESHEKALQWGVQNIEVFKVISN